MQTCNSGLGICKIIHDEQNQKSNVSLLTESVILQIFFKWFFTTVNQCAVGRLLDTATVERRGRRRLPAL